MISCACIFLCLLLHAYSTLSSISLSPPTWADGKFEKYASLLDNFVYQQDKPTTYDKEGDGIVTSTTSSRAVHTATDVLVVRAHSQQIVDSTYIYSTDTSMNVVSRLLKHHNGGKVS
jgi:hypothetical protein